MIFLPVIFMWVSYEARITQAVKGRAMGWTTGIQFQRGEYVLLLATFSTPVPGAGENIVSKKI
jgi:hypothetical protein